MCYVHNQWYDISCATLYDSARQATDDNIIRSMRFLILDK